MKTSAKSRYWWWALWCNSFLTANELENLIALWWQFSRVWKEYAKYLKHKYRNTKYLWRERHSINDWVSMAMEWVIKCKISELVGSGVRFYDKRIQDRLRYWYNK